MSMGDHLPYAIKSFKREASVLASMNNRSIVRLLGVVVSDSNKDTVVGLVLEFVEGTSLHDVSRDATVNMKRRLGMAISMAKAFSYLHQSGHVHRDTKPLNSMVRSADDSVVLIDFGLAIDTSPEHQYVTSHIHAGTPAYLAPEQILSKGKKPLTCKIDVYAFGIILPEIATGHAWKIQDSDKLCQDRRGIGYPVFSPQSVCLELKAISTKCMSVDASDRPPFTDIIPMLEAVHAMLA